MPGLGLAGGGINIGYHRLWWTGSCLDLASPTRSRVLAALSADCLQTHLASVSRIVVHTNNDEESWRHPNQEEKQHG